MPHSQPNYVAALRGQGRTCSPPGRRHTFAAIRRRVAPEGCHRRCRTAVPPLALPMQHLCRLEVQGSVLHARGPDLCWGGDLGCGPHRRGRAEVQLSLSDSSKAPGSPALPGRLWCRPGFQAIAGITALEPGANMRSRSPSGAAPQGSHEQVNIYIQLCGMPACWSWHCVAGPTTPVAAARQGLRLSRARPEPCQTWSVAFRQIRQASSRCT